MKMIALLVVGSLMWNAAFTSAQENPTQKEREERSIAAIEELKGHAYRNEEIPGHPVVRVKFYQPIKEEDLELVKAFPLLESLTVLKGRISDAGLALLKPFSHLESLDIRTASISDAGLANLHGLRRLHDLTLIDVPITDDALPHLKGMTHLRKVYFGKTKLSQKEVAELKDALPYALINVQPEPSKEASTTDPSSRWPYIFGAISAILAGSAIALGKKRFLAPCTAPLKLDHQKGFVKA